MKVFILLCLLAGTAYGNVFGRLSYTKAEDSSEEYPEYMVQTKYVPRELFDENFKYNPMTDVSAPTLKLFAVAPKVAKPTKKPKKTKEVVVLDPVDQIAALKAECKTKFDDLTTEFETKLNDTATKYQTKYEKLVAINPDETLPEYGLLQSEFASKIDLATQKFNLKEATLLSKYKTQIDALQAQIDALPSTTTSTVAVETDNEAASFGGVPSIFPGQPGPVLIDSQVADQDFGATLDYSRDDDVSTEHALGFQPPMLRLPKVKTTALPVVTTPKVPTIADAYWKAWGAKIGEVFNKTKATTETPDGVIVATDDSVAPAPTTPLPPTFWMTFGKTMGKAFADAKFKIMTTVKATTVAPLLPVDDDLMGIPETTTEFVVDDTFWDEFGTSLGDALANKAIFDAMKTSTVPSVDTIVDDSVIAADSFDYSHDLDSSVPTLRLGEPVVAPVTPVTVPGKTTLQ